MSTGGIVALVIGAVVLVFLAVNRGLVSSGVQIGVGAGGVTSTKGIVAPQPSTNYGGYLAASTAPGVSSALNGALTGLGSGLAGWFAPPKPTPVTAQGGGAAGSGAGGAVVSGAVGGSPSLFAAPVGVQTTSIVPSGALVGPQITPISGLSYDGTSGAAFDYSGLAAANSYDSSASLEYYD